MAHDLKNHARVLLTLCLALAVAASTTGCWTRTSKQTVFDKEGIKIILRSQKRGGETIPKGFQHPATISGVRLANVLSRIEVRTSDEENEGRKPAIDAQFLFEVGDAFAAGLAKADPDQEILVLAKRRAKRLGIFNDEYLTSFTSYVKNDRLVIQLSRVDWLVPKDEKDDKLPEPDPEKQVMKFRVIATDGMTSVGPQGVAVDWRAPQFKAGSSVRVTPGGKVVRKTILMESVDEGTGEEVETPAMPPNLTPQTLRRLADLEESRLRGEMTEAEYSARKSEILRSDAGAAAPPVSPKPQPE